MGLKILPEGIARLLLEGEEDMLTPLVDEDLNFRGSTQCHRCGGSFDRILDPARAFSPDRALPRHFYKCVDCGHTYDPQTGIIIDNGNPAKVEDPFKINVEDP